MAYKFILLLICLCTLNANAFKRIWKRGNSYYNQPCLTLKETQAIGPDAHPRLCSIPEYFLNANGANYPVSPEQSYNQYNLPPNVPNNNYNTGYSNNIPSFPSYNNINLNPPSPLPSYNNGYPPNVPAMENNGIYPPTPLIPSNANVPSSPSSVPILGNMPIPTNVGIYGQPITTVMPSLVSDSTAGLITDTTTTPIMLDTTLSPASEGGDVTTSNSSITDPVIPLSPLDSSTITSNLNPNISDTNLKSGANGENSTPASIGDSSPSIPILPSVGSQEVTPMKETPSLPIQPPSSIPLVNLDLPLMDNSLSQSTMVQGDQSTPIQQSGINDAQPGSVPSIVSPQGSGSPGQLASTSLLNNGGQTNGVDKTTNVGSISDNISTGLNQRGVHLKVAANSSTINLIKNSTCPKGYQLLSNLKLCIPVMTNNLVQNSSKSPSFQLVQNPPALHNPVIVKPASPNPNPIVNPFDTKLPNTQSNSLLPNPFLPLNPSLNSQSNQIITIKSSTVGPLPISKPDFPKINNITKTQTINLPLEISQNNPVKNSTHLSLNSSNNNSLLSTSDNGLPKARGDLLLPNKVDNLKVTGSKPAITLDGICPAGYVLNPIMNICVKSNAAPVPNNPNNMLSVPSPFPGNPIHDAEQNANLKTNILTKDVSPNFTINPNQKIPTVNALKNNLATNQLKDNIATKGDISSNGLLQNNNLNPRTSMVNCNPGLSNFPQFNINCIPFARANAFQRSFKVPGLLH